MCLSDLNTSAGTNVISLRPLHIMWTWNSLESAKETDFIFYITYLYNIFIF